MFQSTFSFWRRIVGRDEPTLESGQATVTHDDRRLWVRYATNLVGNLQLPDRREGDKILAQVRDLSLGGASLLVNRQIAEGEMVTLELPTECDDVHTVLACVVRAEPTKDGNWALGCVFSAELTNEDLGIFGARKMQADEGDPRTWVRFPINVKASCRRVGDVQDTSYAAQVLNISASGIGLAVNPLLQAGSLLNIDLMDKNDRMMRTILACVVHTTQRSSGDFAVGCNFIRELTEDELHSLL
jgi:hypothetical protein